MALAGDLFGDWATLMIEAFGDHFLTDAFFAGHQATPRGDIKLPFDNPGPAMHALSELKGEMP